MADEKANDVGNGLLAVEAALAFGGRFFDKSEDFDAAIDHVGQLLSDAVALFERGSAGSALFLAITAMEETAKAHVGSFRRDKPPPASKGRDPFRDHREKHRMAILPTVFISERLVTALGKKRADALHEEAQKHGFVELREAGLYCAWAASGFKSPKKAISNRNAWDYLILAIEAADDGLVGYTSRSYELGVEWDRLFQATLAMRPADDA
jgi:AbiV family abortive infection protein